MLYCSDKSGICQNVEQSQDPVTTFIFPLYGVISGESLKKAAFCHVQTRYSPEAHREVRWVYSVDTDGASCSKSSLQVLMYQHAWPEPTSTPWDILEGVMRIKGLYKVCCADFSVCILTSSSQLSLIGSESHLQPIRTLLFSSWGMLLN